MIYRHKSIYVHLFWGSKDVNGRYKAIALGIPAVIVLRLCGAASAVSHTDLPSELWLKPGTDGLVASDGW